MLLLDTSVQSQVAQSLPFRVGTGRRGRKNPLSVLTLLHTSLHRPTFFAVARLVLSWSCADALCVLQLHSVELELRCIALRALALGRVATVELELRKCQALFSAKDLRKKDPRYLDTYVTRFVPSRITHP